MKDLDRFNYLKEIEQKSMNVVIIKNQTNIYV